jgi:WD40 repeat protein
MGSQNENILKLILNNLYLNEISILRYTCKQTFLLSYIINRIAQLKQDRLYYRLEDKIDIIYNHFRYDSKGFQTKCHLNFIAFVNPNTLACVFKDGGVSLYDMNTQNEIKSFHLSNSPINLITFKNGFFATLNYDNNIRVFNINKPSDFICIKSNSNYIKKLILKDKDNLIVCNYREIIKYDIGVEGLTNKLLNMLKLKKKSEVLYECPNLLDMVMLDENLLLFSHSLGFSIYDISNKYLKSNLMHKGEAYTITILNQNRFVAFYYTCLKIWDINKKLIITEFPYRSTERIDCAIVFNDNVLIYVTTSHILNGYDITKNNLLFQYKGNPNINLMLKYDENYFITTNRSGYIKFWDIRNMGLYKNFLVQKYESAIVLKNSIAIVKCSDIYLYNIISAKFVGSVRLECIPDNYFKLDDYSFILVDRNNSKMYFVDINSFIFNVRVISHFQMQNIRALRNKFVIVKTNFSFKLLNYDFQLLDVKEHDTEAKSAICIMNRNTFVTVDFKLIIWEISKDNKLKIRVTIKNNSLKNNEVRFLLKIDMSTFIVGNNESITIWDVKHAQCIRDLGISCFKSYSTPILKDDTIIYVIDMNIIRFIGLYNKKVVSIHHPSIEEVLA